MPRCLLAALVLVLSASVADAGPLLNFLENRREARAAHRGGCSAGYSGATYSASPGVTYSLSGSNCATGSCPIPQAVPQAFPPPVVGK